MDELRVLLPAPFSTLHARRICLIKPSALGDVVQALPVLNALRLRYPHSHISWLVNSAYAPLLRPISILDEVIEFDRQVFHRNPIRGAAPFFRFLGELKQRRFDLVIDLQGLLRSGVLAHATRAPKRIGLRSAREGAAWFYTDAVDDVGAGPGAVERYWAVVEALGAGHAPRRFPLELSVSELAAAGAMLAGLPRPLIAIQPGARWETKRWPAERFAAVASRALAGGGSAVLVGGPGEESIAATASQGLSVPHRNLCGKTSLRQLAAVLSQCDLMLTNDSGPMHLAAAVGTPTVALFTCTSPERAGPFGEGHSVVQTTVACRASYLKTCDRMTCMSELTADRVEPVLIERIAHLRRDCRNAA